MPFYDIVQQHINSKQLNLLDQSIDAMEKTLENQKRNLSPEERQRYGRVNEVNKLFVNKVYDYFRSQPAMSSPDVDWKEFAADYEDRMLLETRITRLRSLLEIMENSKILHDYDNFQNALMDYSFTQYKKDSEAGGYVTKYNELRQFFPRTATGANTKASAE
jgi:tRNA A37 N6-isopentenylltransferase MiaA